MSQLENIEAIEKDLWKSADNLRANSTYASNEYFMPVMGLIFLRHAYSRYLKVKDEVEKNLPKRGGQTKPLTKEDFSGKGAIFLKDKAQFDYLASLKDSEDRAQAIIDAMESIEADYTTLAGVLPKEDYRIIENPILKDLINTLNHSALKKASGDIFGRIYEYFLTQFAGQKAHDGGEFFTPVSLVQMIVNVIEPDHGKILDPACGSGGMFVQSAHFMENMQKNPTKEVVFYGQEKNQQTINLAKMNLAVHGLEGNIIQGITYYDDHHKMYDKADFLMANPPFNVDEVDADKIRKDVRLPFGLPGENKNKKVPNGNYLWISYFYSYLNPHGRAGFVMSSQSSSAGGNEKTVRQKIVETAHVDIMMAVGNNFFYTRAVPCELWFFDKAKSKERLDKVLMIDARNVFRKVTRTINDFSPEQMQNLTSIVWLYRGQQDRFIKLIANYITKSITEAQKSKPVLIDFIGQTKKLYEMLKPFVDEQKKNGPHKETLEELFKTEEDLKNQSKAYNNNIESFNKAWHAIPKDNQNLHKAAELLSLIAQESKDLIKELDIIYKLYESLINICETELEAKDSNDWKPGNIRKEHKVLDEQRKLATEQLKLPRYFYKQVIWLQEKFPDAEITDVKGLLKIVTIDDIEKNDWSLSPGRYVEVAPEEIDEEFDFEETLRNIHIELSGLNEEAVQLAAQISKNFEELGV